MSYTAIAWNNLKRNRRRTWSTLIAIGLGTAMIVLTSAITAGITRNMSDAVVRQIDGHLHIQHRDYKKYFLTDQECILIPDAQALAAEVMAIPHVRAVMPRVALGGLVAKDDRTTTFFAFASDLATLTTVLPDYGQNLVAGSLLSKDDPGGVIVGRALAKSLGLALGDELVLLGKTVHGEDSNTLAHVRGIVSFPPDPILEQSLVFAALERPLREDLLDLGRGATQLIVLLDDIANVDEVEATLKREFARQGKPWTIVPWHDNKTYSQLVGMFNGIGRLITAILAAMVGVIASNALLMSFFERIREVRMLRAIGMPRRQVYQMLYIESAIVGAGGILLGLALGAAVVLAAAHIGIPLGGIVNQVVRPTLQAAGVALSVLAPMACILLAAALPICAASRLSVIESLNYQ